MLLRILLLFVLFYVRISCNHANESWDRDIGHHRYLTDANLPREHIAISIVVCGGPQSLHVSLAKRVLLSLAMNKRHHDHYKVYIFYDPAEVPAEHSPEWLFCSYNTSNSRELLRRLHIAHNMFIKFRPVPLVISNKVFNLFKRCATVKLWLPDLLVEEDAVINIDTDMIVMESMQGLWDERSLFTEDNYIAVTEEAYFGASWYNHYRRRKVEARGINTGVVLFDLQVARRLNTTDIYTNILTAEHPLSDFFLGDQDVINVALSLRKGLYRILPCRWNRRINDKETCFDGNMALSPGILHANRDILYTNEYKQDPVWIESTALHRAAYSMYSQLLVRDGMWCVPLRDAAPGSNCADLLAPAESSSKYFNDGYLLRANTEKEVYIILKGYRHPFPNPETFDSMNLSFNDVKVVPSYFLHSIPVGNVVPNVLGPKN